MFASPLHACLLHKTFCCMQRAILALASASFAGLIMAASDLAALFASVGISFWTQRSFKQPLIFSAAACLAGEQLIN